jgi:hypothetical protein
MSDKRELSHCHIALDTSALTNETGTKLIAKAKRTSLGRVLINAQTFEGPLSAANRKEFARSELYRLDPNQTYARSVWRLTIWVPEEQAPLPQSALPLLRRGGRSTHSASLVRRSGDQVIHSGEELSQNRGCVRFVISDH